MPRLARRCEVPRDIRHANIPRLLFTFFHIHIYHFLMYNIYIFIFYIYMYSLTYVLISTMVFGKFSVLRKKAICTKSVLANLEETCRLSMYQQVQWYSTRRARSPAASSRFPTLCPSRLFFQPCTDARSNPRFTKLMTVRLILNFTTAIIQFFFRF